MRIREQQKKQAELRLSRLSEQRQKHVHTINQLSEQIRVADETHNATDELRPQTHTCSALSRYVCNLQDLIEQEQTRMLELEPEFAAAKDEFLRFHIKWESLKRICEKYERAQTLDAQKQYQLSMDDFVMAQRNPQHQSED